jgi:hypothetical protein
LLSDKSESGSGPYISSHVHSGVELTKQPLNARFETKTAL